MPIEIKGLRHMVRPSDLTKDGPVKAAIFLPDDRVMQMAWFIRGELDEISLPDQDTICVFKILKEVLAMSEEDLEKKLTEWWPEKFGCNPRETEPEGFFRDAYKEDDGL